MTFMERVLSLAADRRFSQRELARRTKIDPSRITEWKKREEGEGGGKGPSVEDAMALAGALGTTVAYLVGESGDPGSGVAGQVAEDERTILRNYRALRAAGLIDEDLAIVALMRAARGEASARAEGEPAAAIDPRYRYPAIPADPTPGVIDRLAERAARQEGRTPPGTPARRGKRRG